MFSLIQFGTTAEGLAVNWIVRRINMELHQSAVRFYCFNFMVAAAVLKSVLSMKMTPVNLFIL